MFIVALLLLIVSVDDVRAERNGHIVGKHMIATKKPIIVYLPHSQNKFQIVREGEGVDTESSDTETEETNDDAEESSDDTDGSDDDAENAKDDADNAKDDAKNAKDDSENSKDDSENSKDDAEESNDDTEESSDDTEETDGENAVQKLLRSDPNDSPRSALLKLVLRAALRQRCQKLSNCNGNCAPIKNNCEDKCKKKIDGDNLCGKPNEEKRGKTMPPRIP